MWRYSMNVMVPGLYSRIEGNAVSRIPNVIEHHKTFRVLFQTYFYTQLYTLIINH